jgi:hypothetical protein
MTVSLILGILLWLAATNAHLAAFHKGMYCLNGTQNGNINFNSNEMVSPLYQLSFNEWWCESKSIILTSNFIIIDRC